MITPPKDGITQIVVWNNSGFAQKLGVGAVLGVIEGAEELDVSPDIELMLPTLPSDELQQLEDFLVDAHDVFALEEGEHGETDIV